MPWLPQVWDSVNSANEDERRADYLGAGFKRIMTIVLRITGIGSDSHGAYYATPSFYAAIRTALGSNSTVSSILD